MSEDRIVAELIWTAKIIKDITGVTPTYFRAPQGLTNETAQGILAALKMNNVNWNRDTFDWFFNQYTPDKVIRPPYQPRDNPTAIVGLFRNWTNERPLRPSLSLQHDFYREAAAQVNATLSLLKSSPYTIKKVSDCLGLFPEYSEQIWETLANIKPPIVETKQTQSSALSLISLPISLLVGVLGLFLYLN